MIRKTIIILVALAWLLVFAEAGFVDYLAIGLYHLSLRRDAEMAAALKELGKQDDEILLLEHPTWTKEQSEPKTDSSKSTCIHDCN